MGHYNFVKPGDPFRPSAKLENEVRRFFNGGTTISGGKSKSIPPLNTRISAVNVHTEKISAHTPVAVLHDDEKGFFTITPVSADTALWGVLIENLEPNQSGAVIISGVVHAWVKQIPSTSARAEILFAGDDKTPGMILLGGSAGGSSEYNGYFKLTANPVMGANGNITSFEVTIDSGVCRVNDRRFEVASFSETINAKEVENGNAQAEYILLFDPDGDIIDGSVDIINAASVANIDFRKTPYVSIGRIVNYQAIQDCYGEQFIPYFAPCTTCQDAVESE